ncbi:hypothetical protein DSL72_008044 [Monilinia vaccinii-corymbosi]|uniref:BTB domain-containing protein n=1 Tax=Monilinia vaccinii-corymbosi TaxID=61207 RepID=A0A8A3PIM0_9HELO|nr:hypothetical protein DSL72_008044 [Monilinia vaccinii-corymbosi]
MPPKGSRKQYRRGEVVQVVGDPGNDAFKATNGRKRSSNKLQPSIEKCTIEIESDDETPQPPRKSRPDPRSSTGRVCGADQKERPAGSKQESEFAGRPQNTTSRHILRPGSMFRPFADENADVYIVLVHKDHKHTYRLQSHVLMHASSWFQAPIVVEADPELADRISFRTGIRFRFELIHDRRFGHHVLKRMPLTEYKPVEQPEKVVAEAFSASGLKGQYYRRDSASDSRHALIGMPQYDSPFDEAASGNMVGSFGAALCTYFEHSNPSPGTRHSLPELPVDENQDKGVSIKLEKDTEMQMTSTGIVPTTQNAIKDQIARPPTSPTQARTKSDNGNTNDDGQANKDFPNVPDGHVATPLETPIKAESATGEDIFSQTLPVAQAYPGGQPEAPVNAVEPKQSVSEQDPKKPSDEPVHPDVLDAYHSLFLCYYGFPPTISNADFPTAVKQSKILIKIAALYYSLKLVRPHIIASLLSYGRNLYSAVRQDPPRFLILAFKLQCAPIFKEALIHIVGQAPSWPWPTPQDRIDPALAEIIQKKFEHLKEKKAKANDALFRSCLAHLGVRVSISNLNKETFDMWVVVQIWHDWFSQQLHTCAVTRRDENRSVERNMYRLMAQAGDAYLHVDDIMAMVRPYQPIPASGEREREWGNWDRDQVELEMKIMKAFAAKTVRDLMANELMGDFSESGEGAVEYLTCTQIEERELPWVAVMPIREDESRG